MATECRARHSESTNFREDEAGREERFKNSSDFNPLRTKRPALGLYHLVQRKSRPVEMRICHLVCLKRLQRSPTSSCPEVLLNTMSWRNIFI